MTISLETAEQKTEFTDSILNFFTDYLVCNIDQIQNVKIPGSGVWTASDLEALFPESDRSDMKWELNQLLSAWKK